MFASSATVLAVGEPPEEAPFVAYRGAPDVKAPKSTAFEAVPASPPATCVRVNVIVGVTVAVTTTWSFPISGIAKLPVSKVVTPSLAVVVIPTVYALDERLPFILCVEAYARVTILPAVMLYVPDVGAVRVKTRLLVPENTAPHIDEPGEAARVSVFSRPVVGPSFIVTSVIAILEKLKSDGKVTMIF